MKKSITAVLFFVFTPIFVLTAVPSNAKCLNPGTYCFAFDDPFTDIWNLQLEVVGCGLYQVTGYNTNVNTPMNGGGSVVDIEGTDHLFLSLNEGDPIYNHQALWSVDIDLSDLTALTGELDVMWFSLENSNIVFSYTDATFQQIPCSGVEPATVYSDYNKSTASDYNESTNTLLRPQHDSRFKAKRNHRFESR